LRGRGLILNGQTAAFRNWETKKAVLSAHSRQEFCPLVKKFELICRGNGGKEGRGQHEKKGGISKLEAWARERVRGSEKWSDERSSEETKILLPASSRGVEQEKEERYEAVRAILAFWNQEPNAPVQGVYLLIKGNRRAAAVWGVQFSKLGAPRAKCVLKFLVPAKAERTNRPQIRLKEKSPPPMEKKRPMHSVISNEGKFGIFGKEPLGD